MISLFIDSTRNTDPRKFDLIITVKVLQQCRFGAYIVRLKAVQMSNVGILEFTEENNLLPGFIRYNQNPNNVITEAEREKVGFLAYKLGGFRSTIIGEVIKIASFKLTLGEFHANSRLKLGFATEVSGMDTTFVDQNNQAIPLEVNSKQILGEDFPVIAKIRKVTIEYIDGSLKEIE